MRAPMARRAHKSAGRTESFQFVLEAAVDAPPMCWMVALMAERALEQSILACHFARQTLFAPSIARLH